MPSVKRLEKLLIMAAIFLGFTTCANGQITWNLADVTFSNGNVAGGSFTTNDAVTMYDSINVTVSGPDTVADFTASIGVDPSLPRLIGLFGHSKRIPISPR